MNFATQRELARDIRMILGNVELYNIETLLPPESGDGRYMSRLPAEVHAAITAQHSATCTAGAEIRCNLTEGRLNLSLLNERAGVGIVEVYSGPFAVGWHYVQPNPKPTEITVRPADNLDALCEAAKRSGLSFDPRLTRVLLPATPEVRLLDVSVQGAASVPRPEQTPAKRCLAYGSSITHGCGVIRPSGTYPMRVAQLLNADCINLGLGSGALIEKEVADHIAGRSDWDFATLELGVNALSLDAGEFERRVRYMIETIASRRPEKWVFCIDILPFARDIACNETVSPMKHEEFRAIVPRVVGEIGRDRLVHIDGGELLRGFAGHSADLTHPTDLGMETIARNLSSAISPYLMK